MLVDDVIAELESNTNAIAGWSASYDGSVDNGILSVLTSDITVYAIWDVMDDVTTSVDGVNAVQQGLMYDLLGRPVDENYKGVVVIKGQKYMLK